MNIKITIFTLYNQDMTHGEWLKNLLNESIEKFQSFYEDEHGFKLPQMKVKDVKMHVKFPYQNGNKLIVSFLHIITEVEKKDGRMGKVKKFIKDKHFFVNEINCDEYLLENKEGFLTFIEELAGKSHKTFPMVFYRGKFIGGLTDTMDAIDKILLLFDEIF